MPTHIFQHIFSQEKGSGYTDDGVEDVEVVGIGRIKSICQKALDSMDCRAKHNRRETRKYTYTATENQDKGLIANVSEPVDQQASNEVVFSQT